MTEDQQKTADRLVSGIESFWGPIIEDVTRRTGWTPEQIWGYQVLGCVQEMKQEVTKLLDGYARGAQEQQDFIGEQKKLQELCLKALDRESEGDDWNKDVEQEEG